MKLVYAAQAVADLARLRAFVAEKNPGAAARIAQKLLARVDHLRRFPEMGVRVEQAPAPAEVRDIIFGDYIVRYSVHDVALAILRIWHHFEDRVQPSSSA